MENYNSAKDRFFHYKTNPLDFVIEVLRIPEISRYHHISDQQKELLIWLGKKVEANYRSWNHMKLGKKDKPFPAEMQELAQQFGASVMSGKGTGKDGVSSWICLWAICCFENCKVYIIAPNERSIKQILFPEIAKWCDAKIEGTGEFAFKLRDYVTIESERIYFNDVPTPKMDRCIEPIIVSPQLSEEQQKNVLSGRHEKNMFFIFEEACGIKDSIYQPIEDTLTSENNMAFQIFNPNRTGGYSVNSQKEAMAPYWAQFQWNAEKSSIASQENIKRLEALYGRDSNKFRTNVLGLPPLADEEALIPHDWVMQAAMQEVPVESEAPIFMGVDPARFGGDETVVAIRQGRKCHKLYRFRGLDGRETADRMIEIDQEWDMSISRVFIDAIGVGASPYDFAKEYFRKRIRPVIVSNSPKDERRFYKLRDELWWKCREWFAEGISEIPYDNDLIEQLSDVRYTDHGKIKVEGKRELKKRKGSNDASPDIADALNLTFMEKDLTWAGQTAGINYQKKRAARHSRQRSWMSR